MTHRVAIIGAGAPIARTNSNLEGFSIGWAHAAAYRHQPDTEVVAVADISAENAAALADWVGGAATYHDHETMLITERPDVVSICTWPTLHHRMTLDAIRAGAAIVLCEKPMAVSMAEVDEMVAAARSAGCRLFVNHQRRYSPNFIQAHRLVSEGLLGDVLRIEGYVGDGWDLMSWGSHWVDMARWFANDVDVSWVLAATNDTGHIRYGHRVEDQMLLQFGFRDGPLALVHTGPHTTGASFLVIGTNGAVLVGKDLTIMTTGARPETAKPETDAETPEDGAFTRAIADCFAATAQRRPSLIDGESGAATTEVMMAAYTSAASRGVVHMPLVDRSITLRPLTSELPS